MSGVRNNSVRVCPMKLKIGMLDHMSNTFWNSVFWISVDVPLRNKCIIWYQNVLPCNLLKQTERRFLTSWCILRSPSVWLWISNKFCIYQYVTLPFLWNPILDQSRAIGGYSHHLQFSGLTNDHNPANGTNCFFTLRTCTYRISSQTKYTRKCTLSLTELLK